jgi:aspartokinase-like uncharacterized kinase
VKPVVVKLGGSLAETGQLRRVLSLVCRAQRPVIIVPGGGPYADAVRASQRELRFSDAAAHDMAILAMNQMGLAMVSLEPRLVAVETLAATRLAVRERRIPVWLPAKLCAGDRDIPRDWSITSDGLAARLAERLGGAPVVLVKSCAVARSATAEELGRSGVVDKAFAGIVRRAVLTWHIVGPGEEGRLAELLDVLVKGPVKRPGNKPGAGRSTRRAHHARPQEKLPR